MIQRPLQIAASLLLACGAGACAHAAPSNPDKTLWQIGQADDSSAEFANDPTLEIDASQAAATPAHDLDVLARWLRSKRRTRARHVDCCEFLAAWNLFGDLSRSLGASFDADHNRTGRIYGKLLWGSNLPSMTPPGEKFMPYWPGREVDTMHEVLSDGLALFRANVRLNRED